MVEDRCCPADEDRDSYECADSSRSQRHSGVGDLKIIDALLGGERDRLTLARLCHGGVKNSEDTIAKSFEGAYLFRSRPISGRGSLLSAAGS